MKLSYTKRMVLTAVCAALCVVLPMAFHAFPGGGNVFLPMHIPVLLCGLMCSWPYGFICGLLGPALSCLLTQMPPVAFLPSMMVECAVYGCVAGAMMVLVRTKSTYLDLYISMVTAMVVGRVAAGFAKAFVFAPGTPIFAWVSTSLVEGIPGIVIQLALIPSIVYALMRARLLPHRYPKPAMNKQDVIAFFDGLAPQWDAEMIRSDEVIGKILDGAGVREGVRVLDVACGTGVLIPDYLQRQVASVTAVDISRQMVEIAKEKFPQENVTVLCGDIETVALDEQFDCIVVYNAFPHFPDPENLIRVLAGRLTPGGKLTVAHGMSREKIDARHKGSASKVSVGLMHEDDLAKLFAKHLKVTVKISDDTMYQVTGTTK